MSEEDNGYLAFSRGRARVALTRPYASFALYQAPIRAEEGSDWGVRFSHELRWQPDFFRALSAEVSAYHILHELGHMLFDTERRCEAHRSVDVKTGAQTRADPELFWLAGCLAIDAWMNDSAQADGVLAAVPGMIKPKDLGLPEAQTHEFYYERLKDSPKMAAKARLAAASAGCGMCGQNRPAANAESKSTQDAVRAATARQLSDHMKTIGKDPLGEALEFTARYAPQINFGKFLSREMSRSSRSRSASDSTFSVLHRKQAALGFGPNAPRMPARRGLAPAPVAMILDTSGSIGSQDLDHFASEFSSLMKQDVPVFLIVTDAAVHSAGMATSFREAARMVKGGGGTDFTQAFSALCEAEKRHRFSACFILSDGMVDVPKAQPFRTQAVWVLIGGQPRPAPWGAELRFRRSGS